MRRPSYGMDTSQPFPSPARCLAAHRHSSFPLVPCRVLAHQSHTRVSVVLASSRSLIRRVVQTPSPSLRRQPTLSSSTHRLAMDPQSSPHGSPRGSISVAPSSMDPLAELATPAFLTPPSTLTAPRAALCVDQFRRTPRSLALHAIAIHPLPRTRTSTSPHAVSVHSHHRSIC